MVDLIPRGDRQRKQRKEWRDKLAAGRVIARVLGVRQTVQGALGCVVCLAVCFYFPSGLVVSMVVGVVVSWRCSSCVTVTGSAAAGSKGMHVSHCRAVTISMFTPCPHRPALPCSHTFCCPGLPRRSDAPGIRACGCHALPHAASASGGQLLARVTDCRQGHVHGLVGHCQELSRKSGQPATVCAPPHTPTHT